MAVDDLHSPSASGASAVTRVSPNTTSCCGRRPAAVSYTETLDDALPATKRSLSAAAASPAPLSAAATVRGSALVSPLLLLLMLTSGSKATAVVNALSTRRVCRCGLPPLACHSLLPAAKSQMLGCTPSPPSSRWRPLLLTAMLVMLGPAWKLLQTAQPLLSSLQLQMLTMPSKVAATSCSGLSLPGCTKATAASCTLLAADPPAGLSGAAAVRLACRAPVAASSTSTRLPCLPTATSAAVPAAQAAAWCHLALLLPPLLLLGQVELDKLDYHHYLPIFLDGIRETRDPYRFLAIKGVEDLLAAGAAAQH
eukprot:GHRQ01038697.1.p1 GENE.GHRQ01038697.1~~GHRQ01038697.1.p1  ORF type:complete len:310 (-),score=99.72 GHRQ01038697.1:221-1150(-)